jgi:hypothetical protein
MDYNSLSGLDKAAILFKVLGEPLAVSFFSGVSKEKLMKVRVRSNELAGQVPTIIKKQILEEYSFMLLQDRYRKSKPDATKLFEFLDDLIASGLLFRYLSCKSINEYSSRICFLIIVGTCPASSLLRTLTFINFSLETPEKNETAKGSPSTLNNIAALSSPDKLL